MTLALNTATTKRWTVAEAVAGCVRAGVTGIGLWRDRVAEVGAERAGALARDAGLTVTSLCRGGFFADADAAADNRAAVEEAAAVGTAVLVLVCGGLPPGSTDLAGARARVADGVAELAPYARAAGVTLAVEPMHPMFCADRGVVSTLGQALDLADQVPGVGVVVDTYHVWWDPAVEEQIARAADRIALVQVSDWVTPLPAGVLLGRGHVGDGSIDNRGLVAACRAAGYPGAVEVEIFNEEIWNRPGEETLTEVVRRYRRHIG